MVTLGYPDVSAWQAGLKIQAGTVAVIAKATEGTYDQDPCFHDFMAQAEAVGAIESGYHLLRQGNAAAQADYCHGFAASWPMMLDCEPLTGSDPTVSDCVEFINRFQALGGRVWGCYFPRWYWEKVGGDLRPLRDLGVSLISSDYSGYTEAPTGAGWLPYGGLTPVAWQYTNQFPYGGKWIDFNAFRGTIEDLRSLINGDDMTPADFWSYHGSNGDAGHGPDAPDVHQSLLAARDGVTDLKGTVAQHTIELESIAATVARIAEKIGA